MLNFAGLAAHFQRSMHYDEQIRKAFPKCSLRKYTISEIINAVIQSGFILKKFDEHPAWINPDLPGEFTLIAAPCKTPD